MAAVLMAGLLELIDLIGWPGHQGQAGSVTPQVGSGSLQPPTPPPSAIPTMIHLGTHHAVALISVFAQRTQLKSDSTQETTMIKRLLAPQLADTNHLF